eukprot:15476567-Alexandrium_andersonii.AAC.1
MASHGGGAPPRLGLASKAVAEGPYGVNPPVCPFAGACSLNVVSKPLLSLCCVRATFRPQTLAMCPHGVHTCFQN